MRDRAAANSPAISFELSGDLAILPAAVEVAAYRIGHEAISNAQNMPAHMASQSE